MTERMTRTLLAVMVLSFTITGAAYLGISNTRRWHPDVVGMFCLLTAAITLVVVLQPRNIWAYRYGGTVAIGALLLRTVSVFMGLFLYVDKDALWISLSGGATTAMICGLYWYWWLHDVKAWHEGHKRIGPSR